jgi:hypothetical protein
MSGFDDKRESGFDDKRESWYSPTGCAMSAGDAGGSIGHRLI